MGTVKNRFGQKTQIPAVMGLVERVSRLDHD
jgi:hypothetical protein